MKKFYLRDYNEYTDLSDYEMSTQDCIKAYCKQCCGFSSHEALSCKNKCCPLYKVKERYWSRNPEFVKKRTINIKS